MQLHTSIYFIKSSQLLFIQILFLSLSLSSSSGTSILHIDVVPWLLYFSSFFIFFHFSDQLIARDLPPSSLILYTAYSNVITSSLRVLFSLCPFYQHDIFLVSFCNLCIFTGIHNLSQYCFAIFIYLFENIVDLKSFSRNSSI